MKSTQFSDKLLLALLAIAFVLPVVFMRPSEGVITFLTTTASGIIGALLLLIKPKSTAQQQNKIINSDVDQSITEK